MTITHCPLCVGLAVLSAIRFMAHAVITWSLLDGGTPGLSSPSNGLNTPESAAA